MKKIIISASLLFYSFSFSQSQTSTILTKTEKISYKHYDNLKYIKQIIPTFNYSEDIINTYSDSNPIIGFSPLDLIQRIYISSYIVYPTGSIEFFIKSPTLNIQTNGFLRIEGVNRFLEFSNCTLQKCDYKLFVNTENVYNGTAKNN